MINKILPFALLVTFVPHMVTGQSNSTLQTEPTSAETRHAAYHQLNRQIYARHGDPGSGNLNDSPQKAASASEQLEKMIAEEIELSLAAPKPSASDITAAIANLQGELTLAPFGSDTTNTPFAQFFTLKGVPSLAVAYVIVQGGDGLPNARPHLKFYDTSTGLWKAKAAAPVTADFRDSTFSIAQLNSTNPDETWFIVWGGPLGSTHGNKLVRVYAFDGSNVRTIWKRDRLDAGKVTVTPESIALDYFDNGDRSIERFEIFHITPNGIELARESSKQW